MNNKEREKIESLIEKIGAPQFCDVKYGIYIYKDDAHNFLKKLPKNSIELLLTDIPYNEVNRESNGLRSFDKGVADNGIIDIDLLCEEFSRITKESIYVWCGTEQVSTLRKNFVANHMSTRQCGWKKTNPSPINSQYVWLSDFELCVYAKKPKATFNRFYESAIWTGSNKKEVGFSCEKPLWLISNQVDASSKLYDIVCDPFQGSATTAIACMESGRFYIGCENDLVTFDLGVDRIKKYVLS